jgi:hypothetical protein
VTEGKKQKRAGGATPHFRLSLPKKFRGVTPALHAGRVPFFPTFGARQTSCNAVCITSQKKKGGNTRGTAESTIQKTKN